MKIQTLKVSNLRNIQELVLECDQGIHYIHGKNGQGKTTLLEAIHLLSNLRTFRESDTESLIQKGSTQAQAEAQFDLGDQVRGNLRVELKNSANRFEKRGYINDKWVRSAVDYYGVKRNHHPLQFHAIVLNPNSLDLIRRDPGFRRNALNAIISAENPEHLDHLRRYQKLIDQKNALLKQEGPRDQNLYEVLNEAIIPIAAKILWDRMNFLDRVYPKMSGFLAEIAPNQRPVKLGYSSKIFPAEVPYFTGQFPIQTIQNLESQLIQKLAEFRSQEWHRGSALVGPHRDDLLFQDGHLPLADTGSQGEIRSVLLALKLAELEEFRKQTGITPVLLIDDFSSELDQERRGYLLEYLKNSPLQIFVTSTEALEVKGKRIHMVEGKISDRHFR